MKMHSPGQSTAASMTACWLRSAHPRQAARAARVVQRPAVLGDVGDAVLELHEHVGAVVDAQPVAGAQVLIDPHPHDETYEGYRRARSVRTHFRHYPVEPDETPPAAKQVPHTWQPPDGRRSTIRGRGCATATIRTRSPTSRPRTPTPTQWFAAARRSTDTLFEEIKSRVQETDLAVPVRKDGWWYTARTEEGLSYADPLPRPHAARPPPTRCCSTRTSRPPGTTTSRSRRSRSAPTTPCSRGRATPTAASGTRCASATSAPAPTSPTCSTNTSWAGCAWSADNRSCST